MDKELTLLLLMLLHFLDMVLHLKAMQSQLFRNMEKKIELIKSKKKFFDSLIFLTGQEGSLKYKIH